MKSSQSPKMNLQKEMLAEGKCKEVRDEFVSAGSKADVCPPAALVLLRCVTKINLLTLKLSRSCRLRSLLRAESCSYPAEGSRNTERDPALSVSFLS